MRETIAPVQTFGEFIKQGRLAKGFTQDEVAHRADVDQGHISRIENGIKEPTLSIALKICDVLDLNINDWVWK